MIDVQQTLETYFPRFVKRHYRIAAVLSRFLGFMFYEKRLKQFEEKYPHLEGFDFVEQTLRFFDFSLRLTETERARIPTSGRVVIAANHPIGSLDGLALLHLVRQVRPDVKVVANQLLTAIEPLEDVLLPVNNMSGNTARRSIKAIRHHLEAEGALIIFPAGEVSRFGVMGVKDAAWQTGFVRFAMATEAPILPVYVAGRNSVAFYSLSFLAKPLSTLWLIREMFHQHHNTVDARVGRAVPYEIYSSGGFHYKQLAKMFRKQVYRLANDGKPVFQSVDTVAPPESRLLLKRELENSELLGETGDGKKIFLCTMNAAPCVMREIGRLRELTFRAIGEGTGLPRDIDRFDAYYNQLVLWDEDDLEIVGAYRVGDARDIVEKHGVEGLYTNTLFEYGPGMERIFSEGLELGRSFVQRKYQTKHALDYLWYGIGAYVSKYPGNRFLFGPASISRQYGKKAIARIAHFFSNYHDAQALEVRARRPFETKEHIDEEFLASFSGEDRESDYGMLRDELGQQGLPIPTLYKHYAQVAEPAGTYFTAFNIDPDFGDCVDSFVMVDLEQLKPKKRKRYLKTSVVSDAA